MGRRIDSEKRVVSRMIRLYCQRRLGMESLTEEYRALESYAHRRLDGCKFGDAKPACKRCKIHCYRPDMRDKIRAIMRWAGPRMILYDPIAAIRHLLGL
ncbi:MAG: nitrous oxide-stimulated promoter family protein [Rikenellaceae bacterium]|nr:nitrous oxide-stimulated promoter family protein [Rikenellaceae bacterium]